MVAQEMQAVFLQCALNHLRRFPLPAEAVHMPMSALARGAALPICLWGWWYPCTRVVEPFVHAQRITVRHHVTVFVWNILSTGLFLTDINWHGNGAFSNYMKVDVEYNTMCYTYSLWHSTHCLQTVWNYAHLIKQFIQCLHIYLAHINNMRR